MIYDTFVRYLWYFLQYVRIGLFILYNNSDLVYNMYKYWWCSGRVKWLLYPLIIIGRYHRQRQPTWYQRHFVKLRRFIDLILLYVFISIIKFCLYEHMIFWNIIVSICCIWLFCFVGNTFNIHSLSKIFIFHMCLYAWSLELSHLPFATPIPIF